MSTSATSSRRAWPRAASASVEGGRLRVGLKDGREISVPIDWFGWLRGATEAELQDFHLIEDGGGIWWESIDEGVSVPWLFGLPEFPPRADLDRYVVEYRQDGRRWVAEIPDLDSSTWARTLSAAKRDARVLIARLLDVHHLDRAGIEVVDEVHSAAPARVGAQR